MLMSLEKHVLLRAKVLKMNSKSLENSDCCMSSRSARASGDPWRSAKWLFFSDGAGHRVKA